MMKKTKFKENLSRAINGNGKYSKIRGITLISLVLFVVLFSIINENGTMHNLINKNYKLGLEENKTLLKLETKEDNNVLLNFENENGIKELKSPNGITFNVNGKRKLSMDYKVEKGKKYIFETVDSLKSLSQSFFITPESHIAFSFDKETDTDINIDKVNSKLSEQLGNKQIATSYINIESGKAVNEDTNSTNASEIFNKWIKYPDLSTVGSANYNANWSLSGNSIRTNADVSWTGYWNKENSGLDSDIKISFDSYSGDNSWGDPIGFTFRMTEPSTNVFSFYAVELDHEYNKITLARINSWAPATQNMSLHCGPLYDMVLHNCSGQILSSVSYNLPTSTWLHTKIEIEDHTIRIYMGDTKVIEVTEADSDMLKKGGYGPWVASNPYAYFTNVSISTLKKKELLDILNETTWGVNIPNFIVNINDNDEPALNNEETCNAFNDNNIYYIGISLEENKVNINNFISKIPGGIFINSSDGLESKYEQIASYIGKILKDEYN